MTSPIDLKPSFGARSSEAGAGLFSLPRQRDPGGGLRRFLSNPTAALGVILLACAVTIALTGPVFSPGDPLRIVGATLIAPFIDLAHPLRTDGLGRDLLADILHGARILIAIGLVVARPRA